MNRMKPKKYLSPIALALAALVAGTGTTGVSEKAEAKPADHFHGDLYGHVDQDGKAGVLTETVGWRYVGTDDLHLRYFLKDRATVYEDGTAGNFLILELLGGSSYTRGIRAGAQLRLAGVKPLPQLPRIERVTPLTEGLGLYTGAGILFADEPIVEGQPILKGRYGHVQAELENITHFGLESGHARFMFRPRIGYEIAEGIVAGLRAETDMHTNPDKPDSYTAGVFVGFRP